MSVEVLGSSLGAEIALARAAAAARRGELDEADRLLRDLPTAELSPAGLDLRARVHAQRGEFTAADACWALVQDRDPDNAEAAAGRKRIEGIATGRRGAGPRPSRVRRRVIATVAACAVGAAGLAWLGPLGNTPAAPTEAQTRPSGAPAPVHSLEQRADDADRRMDALSRSLAIPGVRLEQRAEGVRVVFAQGLFARGDQLSPAGAAMLARLGRQLAGRPVSVTVIGHAVAVPGGVSRGGSVVALARAIVAARLLADGSGLPLTSFKITSADQGEGPYPDPARNRTVTLLVAPTNP